MSYCKRSSEFKFSNHYFHYKMFEPVLIWVLDRSFMFKIISKIQLLVIFIGYSLWRITVTFDFLAVYRLYFQQAIIAKLLSWYLIKFLSWGWLKPPFIELKSYSLYLYLKFVILLKSNKVFKNSFLFQNIYVAVKVIILFYYFIFFSVIS